jgi:hypothetical protein
MKVLLIFPPQWLPYSPYLSLPSLCAYLKSHGINTIQKDFNIEAYDLLLSKKYIEKVGNDLKEKFTSLEQLSVLDNAVAQKYYFEIYQAYCSADYIADKVDEAKNTFRSKQRYFNIEELTNARMILKRAQEIISIGCFPSGHDLIWTDETNIPRSYEDIKDISQNSVENPFLELYKNHFMPYVTEQNPDVIGISIAGNCQLVPALTLSRLIKEGCQKSHVVVGGNVITLLSDTLIKYPELFKIFFDSAVVHEGEGPLLKLIQTIDSGKDLHEVPNLVYLNRGKTSANSILPSVNINTLPTPCFDGLPLDLYLSPEPVLSILSSRGCYWGKCTFCADNESFLRNYQKRDAQKVVSDMEELSRKYKTKYFAFSDEAISPGSLGKISDEISSKGLAFSCYTNARFEQQFTPELCEKISKAGFRLLFFGLESGSNRVLSLMEKGITKELAIEVCKNVYSAGIWNRLYVFFGFPTETRDEARETINFLVNNRNIIRLFGIGNFVLYKKSDVSKQPEAYSISRIDKGPHTDFALTWDYVVSPGMSPEEAAEVSMAAQNEITSKYDNKDLSKLHYEDVLLYLAHFEKSDPSLERLKQVKTASKPSKQVLRENQFQK